VREHGARLRWPDHCEFPGRRQARHSGLRSVRGHACAPNSCSTRRVGKRVEWLARRSVCPRRSARARARARARGQRHAVGGLLRIFPRQPLPARARSQMLKTPADASALSCVQCGLMTVVAIAPIPAQCAGDFNPPVNTRSQ